MAYDKVFAFLERSKEYKATEEFQLYKTLRKYRLSLHAMRDNYKSLFELIKWYHLRSENREFWSFDEPYERWKFQTRITTSLLNYLGSKETLVYLTRNFMDEHFDDLMKARYEKHKKEIFHSKVDFKVANRLRAYFVHYSLPDVGVFRELIGEREKKSIVYLHSRELAKWESWNADERGFLNSTVEMLDIEELLVRYHKQFLDTQDRVYLEAMNKYRTTLEGVLADMKTLHIEAENVNHVNSLPFRPSAIRNLEYLLAKSKVMGFEKNS